MYFHIPFWIYFCIVCHGAEIQKTAVFIQVISFQQSKPLIIRSVDRFLLSDLHVTLMKFLPRGTVSCLPADRISCSNDRELFLPSHNGFYIAAIPFCLYIHMEVYKDLFVPNFILKRVSVHKIVKWSTAVCILSSVDLWLILCLKLLNWSEFRTAVQMLELLHICWYLFGD